MLHIHLWSPSTGLVTDLPPDDLPPHRDQAGAVLWLDADCPTGDELALLGHQCGLSQLTIEDLTKQGQRAKLEQFDGYLFLVMHALALQEERLTTPEVDFVLGRHFVLSVHRGALAGVTSDPHVRA